jgi:hypothetical protein
MVCLEPFAPKIWLAKVRVFRRNSKQGENVNFENIAFSTNSKRLDGTCASLLLLNAE